MESSKIHFGKRIKEKIKKSGMTIVHIAKKMDTTPNNLYKLFKQKNVNTKYLVLLSQVLEIDLFELITNKSDNISNVEADMYEIVHQFKENTEKAFTKLVADCVENDYTIKDTDTFTSLFYYQKFHEKQISSELNKGLISLTEKHTKQI